METSKERPYGANLPASRVAAIEARNAPDLDAATKAVEWHMCKPGREKSAMRALENLTPGGSEYVGDIARCIEFVRQRQASQHQHIISLTKRLRASPERDRLMEGLVRVSPRIVRDGDGDVWMHMPNVHLNLSLQGGPIIRKNLLAWSEGMQSALREVEAMLGGK